MNVTPANATRPSGPAGSRNGGAASIIPSGSDRAPSFGKGRADMAQWTPSSWQRQEALQQPTYLDLEARDRAVEQLSKLPPLVTSWEIETLKKQLAEACEGRRFLLQGGWR